MDTAEPLIDTTLCPADQAALDALIDASFELADVPPAHAPRAERLLRQMGLLGDCSHASGCDGLVRDCLARVALAQTAHEAPELVPQDEDALESLVQHNFDPRRTASAVRQRASAIASVLALLPQSSAERAAADAAAKEALVQSTLLSVQQAVDQQELAMKVAARPRVAGRRFRLPDLVSVAAMLLIGVAVAWPVMSAARERSRLAHNESNLRSIGQGMGMYSGSSGGALPVATASIAGVPWWNVGHAEQSNSANLFTLIREGYTCPSLYKAPGNRAASSCIIDPQAWDWACIDEVPYSYQNQFARRRTVWRQSPDMIVLADRSPVTLRAIARQWVDPLENSPNSGGRGQHTLHLDGAVAWSDSPVTARGDNIWLPRQLEDMLRRAANQRRAEPLQGTEQPAGIDDTFLVP